MARLTPAHEQLDDNGVGKCSVPMWCEGMPAGFCDQPAYGLYVSGKTFRANTGEVVRFDGKYNGYVPALACPGHGGPKEPTFHEQFLGTNRP